MKHFGGRALRTFVRKAQGRFGGKVLALLYHRVRPEAGFDPYLLGVSPEHFAEQLEVLPRFGRPMSLQQLVQALRMRKLPHRALVVTFDDGYADNLYHARPLLERHDFPATVFVTSGYLGQTHEFWWEDLARLLLHPGRLPDVLRLTIGQHAYHWELGEAASYSKRDYE